VSAPDNMETPGMVYARGDALSPRQIVEREACEAPLLDAISKMAFTPTLREHVRCQSEFEAWLRTLGTRVRFAEVDAALQARLDDSVVGRVISGG
jgi:hypothetical protein